MKHLHAYWRISYIEAPKQSEEEKNPFLTLPQCKDDRKALILYRASSFYIVLNKFPYNVGHLLVVPYRKVIYLGDLSSEEQRDMMAGIIKAQRILEQALQPDGFNIGFNFGRAAGAGIPDHLHCHVVPRWEGDTNFMPVLSETRVLPIALETMWERLHPWVETA